MAKLHGQKNKVRAPPGAGPAPASPAQGAAGRAVFVCVNQKSLRKDRPGEAVAVTRCRALTDAGRGQVHKPGRGAGRSARDRHRAAKGAPPPVTEPACIEDGLRRPCGFESVGRSTALITVRDVGVRSGVWKLDGRR